MQIWRKQCAVRSWWYQRKTTMLQQLSTKRMVDHWIVDMPICHWEQQMCGTQEVESYKFCQEHLQSSRTMLVVRLLGLLNWGKTWRRVHKLGGNCISFEQVGVFRKFLGFGKCRVFMCVYVVSVFVPPVLFALVNFTILHSALSLDNTCQYLL